MFLELSRQQLCLVERLIENRLDELRSELRRTQNFQFKDELRSELEQFTHLLHDLHQGECDVMA